MNMKKVACFLLLTFLLLTTMSARTWTDNNLPPELQRLSDEAFQYYSSRQTDKFFAAVQKVKKATQSTKYEETIHRAVEEFVGDAEPSDDLTKMCIKMI